MFYYVSVKVGEMIKHKISKDLCFKIVCSGKDAMASKYMTAISIGNPRLSGVIIINDFNGASSVKRFSVAQLSLLCVEQKDALLCFH